MAGSEKDDSTSKLRVALIVDSKLDSKYVCELAKWGQSQKNLEISHLLIQNVPLGRNNVRKAFLLLKKRRLLYLMRAAGFSLIEKLESLGLNRITAFKNHMSEYDLADWVKNTVSITPTVSKSGYIYRYEGKELKKIQELGLDIIIRCGSGILHGDILHSARFGVISLHHADNRVNRGVPPGFWEVYLKQDSTGFTIQQLTEELDGGNVLFRGNLSTKFSYLLNQAVLYERSNYYLKKLLSRIAESGKLPQKLPSYPYYNQLYKIPTLSVQLKYVLYLASAITKKVVDKSIFKKSYRWGIAFFFGDWKDLVMWRGIRVENPPNSFLADPFVVSVDGGNYCFVEEYNYQRSKGRVSVYQLTEKDSKKVGDAIIEPFHLSYPYVFQYKSKYYLCPETCENKDIRLYECESFPLKWKLNRVIMTDICAVDTTIFEKDGTWWLFTNIDPTQVGDVFSELHIFFSDNPVSGNWTPHPMNPIYVDSVKARMGGILFDNGLIYRVSQQQAFDMYGKSCAINQIDLLSKTDFKETVVSKIEPNFFNGLKGTHHLHSNGKVAVFDYVEKVRTNS